MPLGCGGAFRFSALGLFCSRQFRPIRADVRILLAGAALFLFPQSLTAFQQTGGDPEMIPLPSPRPDGSVSVEAALSRRRSVRGYTDDPLTIEILGQLLWAAQGVTAPEEEVPEGFPWPWMGGRRTAPSAGALYPLELYAVVGEVTGLSSGIYRYLPREHALLFERGGDQRDVLWDAALRQSGIREAPVTLVFSAVVARTGAKYGERAERYVYMEVGSAAENVYLQCETLGLGTVLMGAFDDDVVKARLVPPEEERVFGIMPVGVTAGD